jgi:pimeloyl-ACP methyl ester carboxylesterase
MKWLKRILLGLVGLALFSWLALVAWAYWPTGVTEVPARTLAAADDRFVSVDGLDIRYRTWGDAAPDKPTIVMLHGFANSLQSFRLIAPLLTSHYYVVAPDMPGYGLSAKPADFDYRNAHQAKMISDFIAALGLHNVVIAGHSLGGAIALRVAVSDPEVIGLVLMNPGIITTGVPAIAEYLFFPLPRLQAKLFGDPKFRANFLRRSFVDPAIVTDQVVNDLSLASKSEGYMTGMTSLMGQYSAADEVPLLGKVKVPTMVVWGYQDRGKPKGEYEELVRQIPGADGVLAMKSGHYVQEEAPQQAADAINTLAGRLKLQDAPGTPAG